MSDNVERIREEFNKRASKVFSVIDKAKAEAKSKNKWVNVPLFQGNGFFSEISVSPTGTVFLVLRTARVKNRIMIAKPEVLESLVLFVAAFGTSKLYGSIIEILGQNPRRSKVEVIEW